MTDTLHIYLARHAQTEHNAAGIIQGWCDSPLTENGIAGAADAGRKLARAGIRLNAAYCSTSPRTQTTAEIMLHHAGQPQIRPTALPDLREYCFGAFEGQPSAELHRRIAAERGYPDTESWLAAYRSGNRHQLAETVSQIDPNQAAETEAVFLARIQRGLNQAVSDSLNAGHSHILIVSHGMAIAALLQSIHPAASLYQSVPNASFTLLHWQNGAPALIGEAGRALTEAA